MRRDALIVMFGPSLEFPGGMTEVIRAYGAAGVFDHWPLRYIGTFREQNFSAKVGPWLAALGRLAAGLAGGRVALVHVHVSMNGSVWRKALLCALAFAFRVPYVVHLHSGRFAEFYQLRCKGFAKCCVRAWLRNAARVVVLSRHWREAVHDIEPAARISVVGNPVPVPLSMAPLRRPARTVLFLAWLQQAKGVLDLLQAIPLVLCRMPEANFVIAGRGLQGGESPESIMQRAHALGVAHAVRCPGWVDGEKKQRVLREADLFVLPSYCEGLPIALLEAMARGMPVIATRVGGIPDMIEHGVNGLLVEPGAPEALARSIVALLTDEPLRARLRQAAHRDARNRYSTEAVVDELARLYGELGVRVARMTELSTI